MTSALSTLGIIAGGGRLPAQLIGACRHINRPVFVIAFEGITPSELLIEVPHATVRLGAVGEALAYLRNAGAHELVIAGHMKRPAIASLRPDSTGARMLAHIGKAFFGGDDKLLSSVVSFLEQEGFSVIGTDQVMQSLVADSGVLGSITPDAQTYSDIALGLNAAKTLGVLDIGQAVIVEHGYVLGVEAAEGTEALINRAGQLKRVSGRAGVLVKARKPQQDQRVDLPTIGPDTIAQLHAAGLAGVAIEAGGCLMLDRDALIDTANRLGMFVVGVSHAGS